MEILFILLLILLNGLFAMAEIAIVSARKSKLQQTAETGNKNAQAALELSKNPNNFLSTVQVGITLIGIFAGAFGGATIANSLDRFLETIAVLAPYSEALSLSIVVLVITYLSLIIGELVPKRLALSNPEKIAMYVARPMNFLSSVGSPIVTILSVSTDWILQRFNIKQINENEITEEEVRILIREGTKTGVFNSAEKDIVERTLNLGDKKATSLMTPRNEIVWIDISSKFESIKEVIIKKNFDYYPICKGSIDRVVGVINTEEVLAHYLTTGKIKLSETLRKPLFIPPSMNSLKILELFKKSGIHMAIIIDEYGSVEGIITIDDILSAIVGDIPTLGDNEEKNIIKRSNNTYLVDGLVTIDEFKEYFHIRKLVGKNKGDYHTLGGFIIHNLGHIPKTGDKITISNFKIEVIDMDGNRVDKLLVSPLGLN